MRKFFTYLLAIAFLIGSMTLGAGIGAAQGDQTSGFRALSGEEAATFRLPGDLELVTSFDLPAYGLTYERYQQVFGQAGALVYGAQLTLYRSGGTIATVIGAHYPSITPSNQVNLTATEARQRVARDIGQAGERIVDLMIHPDSGRYFYRVETRRADERWFHWIDAGDGAVLNRYNAIMHTCDGAPAPCGLGVQYTEDAGDVKDLSGLTTASGSEFLLLAQDSRQETHDQGSSRRPFLGPVASDDDDSWVTLGDESPAQQALVDAHYYANVTDDYYLGVHSYDWVAAAVNAGANDRMELHAHYSVDYNNAFWNGEYAAFGDGDQVTFEELTALDVVGHELTHGVTDFTSDLVYQDEPGALNESFSDMMGSAMEFYAEVAGLEPATTLEPDWYIGEDFDLRGDTVPGFRNMEDPEEESWSNGTFPDHYTERYTGNDDNGGVHVNSSIPNHAFYLLSVGGLNASCASKSDHNSAHCDDTDDTQDNDLSVTAIGLSDAEAIMFLAFTGLSSDAQMCDARLASEAAAASLFGSGSQQEASTSEAWIAVGLTDLACGLSTDPTPTPTDTPTPTPTSDSDATATPTPTPTDTPTPTPTPDSDTMHVGDLDGNSINNGSTWTAQVTIAVHDASHNPVANATVSGTWSGPVSSSDSCVTGSDGTCTVSASGIHKRNSSVTFTVDSVSDSLTYDSSANHDPDGDSDGTSITVAKP